jgi:glycine dehydrogenase subunit 1
VVREFAIKLDVPVERVIAGCRERGINPGYPLARDYPGLADGLLIAITEQRTKGDIDRLADSLAEVSGALRANLEGARA